MEGEFYLGAETIEAVRSLVTAAETITRTF
jgi:hypothetical protein